MKTILDIISETWDNQSGIRRFSAPSGKMYLIKGFQLTNFTSAPNKLIISRRYAEEEFVLVTDDNDAIFAVDLSIDGLAESLYLQDGIESKHITIGFEAVAGAKVSLKIYYLLVKASMSDLVWEFLKRGKSP